MKIIKSRDNQLVKTWRKWAHAEGRGGLPLLLDSVHVCEAWLTRFGAPDHALFDVDRLRDPHLAKLIAAVPAARVVALPAKVMYDLGHTPSDQGVRFVVCPQVPRVPLKFTSSAVLLDHIQDPGNVGTILRSAAAAGVTHIFLSPGCAAAWSPKVLRSGQGAHFFLNIVEHVDLPALAQASCVPLVVTTLEQAEDLYLTALPAKVLWAFGHEGQGVCPALLDQAQYHIRIDHERAAIDSLNVSMAATLCLFEHRRKHRYQAEFPSAH